MRVVSEKVNRDVEKLKHGKVAKGWPIDAINILN
jgi:hypothetical protein